MASLQEVLASIPGLAGYQAQVNQNNATGMNTLQMAQGAGGILAQIQAQQAKQQALQREGQFRAEIGAATTPEAQLAVAMKYGSPDAVARTSAGHMDRQATVQAAREGREGTIEAARVNADEGRKQRTFELEERGRQHEREIRLKASEGRITADQANTQIIEGRRQLAMLMAANRPERQTPPPIQSAQGLFDRGPNNTLVPLMNPEKEGEQLRPSSFGTLDIRDKQINTRQISGKVGSETKQARDTLNLTNMYDKARETGDNAQMAMVSANLLNRAAAGTNQRFKGEAGKILGGDYGGGSLPERMANFLSTQGTGTPTAKTMKKLDDLMAAVEDAAVENIAERHNYYSGMARGKGLKLTEAIGAPYVRKNRVVFPDGTHATFPDAAAAMNASKLWKDQSE